MSSPVWKSLRSKRWVVALCASCDVESPPVAIDMVIRDDNIILAFDKIGWEITTKAARCPSCKNLPR